MYKIAMYLIIVLGSFVSAPAANLTGVVSNGNGKPIKDAVVKLSNQNLADTTDAQGAFSIPVASSVNPTRFFSPTTEKITLTNGIVMLSLTKAAPVSIELFDMRGNLLERVNNNLTSAGNYKFRLADHRYASGSMLIRVSIGNRTTSFRLFQMENEVKNVSTSTAAQQTGEKLAKMQATVDSLQVSAKSYIGKGVAVTSYTQPVNITLDTINLPYFSFFVTSLKALQDLSKSSNGFGGDLRFGKTGQGAGLLGADSICSCIAERSMPGSKVKMWRAFLSVTKDVNGTQVNAIDRIGQGPWYDRLERLVASNIAGLLNNRPNGDADIKNDLPNEDGVPNHQPDPLQPAVDDHVTVTGSGTDGKLYTGGGGGGFGGSTSSSNYTCDDWTSSTSHNPARAGLSWPRGNQGGMQNWMSVLNATGCEPGIDLSEASMAGKPGVYTIGNGGGYGGFYCFGLNP